MGYDVFLFDADDTLFDFKASERRAFFSMMDFFDIDQGLLEEIFKTYRRESGELWRTFELGKIAIEDLKVERFRRTAERHGLYPSPERMSEMYLEILSDTVVLMEGADDVCSFLSERGEVGILTNGVGSVQKRRLKNSPLAEHVQFMAVSEECGFAKPDVRFFDYAVKMSKRFSKSNSLMIGDRLEADILGAKNFGIDSCFFNPHRVPLNGSVSPNHHIHRLDQLKDIATT